MFARRMSVTAAMLAGCASQTLALSLPPPITPQADTSLKPAPFQSQDPPAGGGIVQPGSWPIQSGGPTDTTCYPNCDGSTASPCLNANDFVCFLNAVAACLPYGDCNSVGGPCGNGADFICFMNAFASQCGVAGAKNCSPP
jgi:hypothetical protein